MMDFLHSLQGLQQPNPPNCADITLHSSKSCATGSKVTRVNLGFLLIVLQNIVPLVANLM